MGPRGATSTTRPGRWLAAVLTAVLLLACLLVRVAAASPARLRAGTVLPGTHCPAFPADNVWNTPITHLPVDSHSKEWLRHMDAGSTDLHPDYGPGGGRHPYGIPWEITAGHPRFTHIRFTYASQSNRGPYPFTAATPIEGGPGATGDRHALMVDPRTCVLYELYDAHYRSHGRSTAGSGAIWNLRSNHLRPAGWTSADAAGLPILPGLVSYGEVESGHIDHAIRFTAQTTDTKYLWPARHEAGSVSNSDYPPMGARFRLSSRFSLPRSRCAKACQVVIQAMKTYGLILADNGSNWFFGGATDRRWTYTMVDQLKAIPASAFVAVDEQCLMIHSDSGQARQPGTAAFKRSCGNGTRAVRRRAGTRHRAARAGGTVRGHRAAPGSAAAARVRSMRWSAPRPVGPADVPAQRAELAGLSCPSSQLCVGAGSNGLVETSTDPGSPGSWSTAQLDDDWPVLAVSCPSASSCIAVNGEGDVFTSADPRAGAWSAPVHVFSDPGDALGGVSCPSVSLCVAVDGENQIATTSDPASGAWSISTLSAPHQLDSVSCPSVTLCAIGDFDGNVLTSSDPAAGGASYETTDLSSDVNAEDTLFSVLSVSCASSTECVAGDDNGDLISSDDPTGGASAWTAAHVDRANSIDTVSCSADGLCLAADDAGNLLTRPVGTAATGTWSVDRDVDPAGFGATACVADELCLAGGDDGSLAVTQHPTATPISWRFTPILGAGPERHPALSGISCPRSFCAVLDDAGDLLTTRDLTASTLKWRSKRVNPGLGAAASLGCGADGLCAAVGPGSHVAVGTAGSAAWRLRNLNLFSLDDDGIAESDDLPAVSCASRSLCVSVRVSNGVSADAELEVSRDPDAKSASWHSIGMGAPDFDYFTSVACPSVKLCIAGDGARDWVAMSTDEGRQWHFVHVASGGGIESVSCPTASFCAVVDREGRVITSADPSGGRRTWHATRVDRQGLVAISCASRSRCAAYDDGGRVLTSSTPAAGARSWASVRFGPGLNGVACPTDRLCLVTTRAGEVRIGRA